MSAALTSLLAFGAAAALLTITPGLDTALVLRTAAVEGPRPAWRVALGIVCGVLAWGLIVAAGLGALLALSTLAYTLLQFAGAAYLCYLGGRMLWTALKAPPAAPGGLSQGANAGGSDWFVRGLLTNLLNPKVGVFYVSLLPQFVPPGADVFVFSVLLAGVHALMGLLWFAVLIALTGPLAQWLRRPPVVRALNGMTGAALLLFGLRLALAPRPSH